MITRLCGRILVLHREMNYRNRLVLGALEVRRHPNNFNRDDALKLNDCWATLLKTRRAAKTNTEETTSPGEVPRRETREEPGANSGQRSRPYLTRRAKDKKTE